MAGDVEKYKLVDMRKKELRVVNLPEILAVLDQELSDNATIGYCTHIGFFLPWDRSIFEGIGNLGKGIDLEVSIVDSKPGFQRHYSPTRTYANRDKRKLHGASIPNTHLSQIPYNGMDSDGNGVFRVNVWASYQKLLLPKNLGLFFPMLLEAEFMTLRKRNPEFAEKSYLKWKEGIELPESVSIINDNEIHSNSYGYFLANLKWVVLRKQVEDQENINVQSVVFVPDSEKEEHPYREHLGQDALLLQLIRDRSHANYIMGEYNPEIVKEHESSGDVPKFVIAPENPKDFFVNGLRGESK